MLEERKLAEKLLILVKYGKETVFGTEIYLPNLNVHTKEAILTFVDTVSEIILVHIVIVATVLERTFQKSNLVNAFKQR